jgi:hypothetical protein
MALNNVSLKKNVEKLEKKSFMIFIQMKITYFLI